LFPGAAVKVSPERIAERDGCEGYDRLLVDSASEAAAALLKPADSGKPSFGELLSAVARDDRPWCQAVATDGERPALTSETTTDGQAWEALATKWLKEAAPTYGLDPATLHKSPPHALLVQHDRASFVGETNNQLPAAVATARQRRDNKKWTRLEVFYLDATAVAGMATDQRNFDERWAKRTQSIKDLTTLLPEVAESWALYVHGDASLFASFWGPAEPDRPWAHIHTSARVWGGEIQNAPAIDYRWHPHRPNLQHKALTAGLDHLRAHADLIAGSPPKPADDPPPAPPEAPTQG
jgi:hypothetical protein